MKGRTNGILDHMLHSPHARLSASESPPAHVIRGVPSGTRGTLHQVCNGKGLPSDLRMVPETQNTQAAEPGLESMPHITTRDRLLAPPEAGCRSKPVQKCVERAGCAVGFVLPPPGKLH